MTTYNLILMIAALALSGISFWLSLHRTDHSQWYYGAYSVGFGCLAFGVYPATNAMAFIGMAVLFITTGLQVVLNALVEGMGKHGIHISKSRHS